MTAGIRTGKAQNEQMLSGLPPKATDERKFGIGSEVPLPELSKIKLGVRTLRSHFEEIRDCNPIQDAFRAL